jgi:hypothetical protein
MSTTGDMIYSSDNLGTATRVSIGSATWSATVYNGLPSWQPLPPPSVQKFVSGSSQTYALGYYFVLSASASLTAGWTYTNNGHTCTVETTTSSVAWVYMACTGDPTVSTSGTLTCSSCGATGNRTYAYWVKAKSIRVKMFGGGAGAAGSGTGGGGSVTAGNNSTFDNLTAAGGSVGAYSASGGNGGAPTVGAGWIDMGSLSGGGGGAGGEGASANGNQNFTGGVGGGPIGTCPGGGTKAASSGTATSGAANTGCGGQGGGCASITSCATGSGGGGGAYVEALTWGTPSSTYTYTVGASANGGTAGTSGQAGGSGGSGMIIVEEYYQ